MSLTLSGLPDTYVPAWWYSSYLSHFISKCCLFAISIALESRTSDHTCSDQNSSSLSRLLVR